MRRRYLPKNEAALYAKAERHTEGGLRLVVPFLGAAGTLLDVSIAEVKRFAWIYERFI